MRNLLFVSGQVFARSFILICMLYVCSLLAYSCKEKDDIQQEGLVGRWEIMKAERNGKETGFLRNGYFIINQNGTMTINITGEDENGKYVLQNNKLMMEGHKTFDIQSLGNDSLTISYVVSPQSHFLFYMKKKQDDAQ